MTVPFRTAPEFLAYLDGLGFFHMDLSLTRMEKALDALGLRRPPFLVAQVVGTNGKGSTATFLAALLQAHGLRTGLYTSPHFVFPSERIMVDGRRVPEDQWLAAATAAWQACPDLTYFEILTAIALAVFREKGVQVAVLEAGLGAHHDATTAVAADLACIAPIALDHTAVLGPDLASIAADKAHAIRSAAPAISAAQKEEATRILEDRAARFHAPLTWAGRSPYDLPLGLAGEHQHENAGLALAALRNLLPRLGIAEDPACVARGLATAFIPGRLQTLAPSAGKAATPGSPAIPPHPACLLDGAHNPHGMGSLVRHLAGLAEKPAAVIFSCLRDKDWHATLSMLAKALPGTPFLLPAMHNSRAERTENMVPVLAAQGEREVHTCETLGQALAESCPLAGDGFLLVTGSLYLLGDFFTLYPEALDPPAAGGTPYREKTA